LLLLLLPACCALSSSLLSFLTPHSVSKTFVTSLDQRHSLAPLGLELETRVSDGGVVYVWWGCSRLPSME
jgi:hypothetical protein